MSVMPDYDDTRTQSSFGDHESHTLIRTISAGGTTERSSHDSQRDAQSALGRAPTSVSRLSSESIEGGDGSRTAHRTSRETTVVDGQSLPASIDVYVEDVVQPGFDEAILRALCDMDVSLYSHCRSRPDDRSERS
jgi:hypothetical protein